MVKRKSSRRTWGKVRKLPSGRYQASYVGPDGNRYTGPDTFSAVIDADAWLAGQRSKIAAGTWTPGTSNADADVQAERARTAGEYAAAWVDSRTGRDGSPLRGTTRAEYLRLQRGPLSPLMALPIVALTVPKIRDWYAAQVKTGKMTQASRAYGHLKSVLQTAVDDGLMDSNPCKVRGAQNATTGRKSEVPTVAELAIIEATMPERLRAAVSLAAWGGLRYGELTELRRRDIEQDEDTIVIHVERAVSRVPGEGFVVGAPKSEAGIRDVALPPQLTATVLEHLAAHVGADPDALLFPASPQIPSLVEKHLSQSSFTKSYYRARAAAGRPDLSWHTLRAFAGTRHAQAGATLRETMSFLGHSSQGAALRYQRTTGRDAALAARMMDA